MPNAKDDIGVPLESIPGSHYQRPRSFCHQRVGVHDRLPGDVGGVAVPEFPGSTPDVSRHQVFPGLAGRLLLGTTDVFLCSGVAFAARISRISVAGRYPGRTPGAGGVAAGILPATLGQTRCLALAVRNEKDDRFQPHRTGFDVADKLGVRGVVAVGHPTTCAHSGHRARNRNGLEIRRSADGRARHLHLGTDRGRNPVTRTALRRPGKTAVNGLDHYYHLPDFCGATFPNELYHSHFLHRRPAGLDPVADRLHRPAHIDSYAQQRFEPVADNIQFLKMSRRIY
jgi:hypothetical protein